MGARERWYYVKDNGDIVEHSENDGATFLRRGAEANEEVVPLDSVWGLDHLRSIKKDMQKLGLDLTAVNARIDYFEELDQRTREKFK
jgi:hypothetical protein